MHHLPPSGAGQHGRDDSAIDAELHRRQVERLLATAPGGALHGDAGVNATFARSFQLVALGAADVPRGEQTAWWSESFRPPLEASSVTGTAFALRALDLYRPDAHAAGAARGRRGLRRGLQSRPHAARLGAPVRE